MFVRTSLTGILSAALAGSALVLTAGSAHAVVDPDDTTFTPVAADLIGVGSDTSQNALLRLANGYNAGSPVARLATYAATGGGTIALPTAAINRPNGSGAGKALLYGAANNTDVDYARSSSALNTAEVGASLQAFPFALDTLKLAVSNAVPSNAPASLTPAQMVSIYKGDVTNWSQLGGSAGVIAPKIPQAGSGTRSFFVAQLKSANGGVDVALAGSVVDVQEHDDTTIKNDPNAVAPFSAGRAGLLGTTLRLEGGFSADRALYNVVRGADLGLAPLQAVFGSDGFVCSDDANALIEAAGFQQLARPEDDGVCGVNTQGVTSDFTLNQPVVAVPTTTRLSASSPAPRAVRLTAVVGGSETPTGSVTFRDTATDVVTGTATVIGGVATLNKTGIAPGTRSYSARYTPAEGTPFEGSSSSTTTVRVKTTSSISESFPSAVTIRGTTKPQAKGTITVTLAGTATTATGRVLVKAGAKTIGSAILRGGTATLTLKQLQVGRNALKVKWTGDGTAAGSSKAFTITVKKRR